MSLTTPTTADNSRRLAGILPTGAGLALLDDVDAAAQRTTLGLGSLATQAAGSVAITGGSITGLTALEVVDDPYDDAGWNGSVGVPTKNAIRDKLESMMGGTFQPLDAELTALAGLTSAADKWPYFTGSGSAALADVTAFSRTLLDDVDATTWRSTLGLGTLATQNANAIAVTGGTISGLASLGLTGGITTTPAAQGSYLLWRIDNNEAATEGADFTVVLRNYPGSNGATRYDNVLTWGYNWGTGGKLNASEHSFTQTIESDYTTAGLNRQLEYYYEYFSPNGAFTARPFGFDINLTTNAITGAFRGNSFKFGKYDGTFDWLSIGTTTGPDAGAITLSGNSSIQYSGTTQNWLLKSGMTIIGTSGTYPTGTLFLGSHFANWHFGEHVDNAANDLIVRIGGGVGSGGRLKWTGAQSTKEWQFQKSNGTYVPFEQVPTKTQMAEVSTTLGDPAGSYTELGYVTWTSTEDAGQLVELTVLSLNSTKGGQKYFIARDYTPGLGFTDWRQVTPIVATQQGSYCIDARSTSGQRLDLRLRRLTSTADGYAGTIYVTVTLAKSSNSTWITATSTGTGATVAGDWPSPVAASDLRLGNTITAGGTTGAQTINKASGTVNFAAAATSLVVTNSLVTANSRIIATVGTNDTTMKSVAAVAGAGSFTLHANAAATGETRVNWVVING